MALAKANQLDVYKDTEILTADQGKLIIMLYNGAIRFLSVAAENMDHHTYDVVNNNIKKAQDIITELMLSLNMEEGGEIAGNLMNIYVYLKKRLLEANIQKDVAILQEVIKHLEQLGSAWDEVTQKGVKSGPSSISREAHIENKGFSIQG